MSHNDNVPERSASRHRPAIWAIAVAIGIAVIAFLVFSVMGRDEGPANVEILAPGTPDPAAGDPSMAGAPLTTAPPANN